jgi:hypothetical protein
MEKLKTSWTDLRYTLWPNSENIKTKAEIISCSVGIKVGSSIMWNFIGLPAFW